MRRQQLQAEYDRLQNQIDTIKDNFGTSPDDLILLGCQAVCVSICGSLEQCLKEIFVEYAKQRSGCQIHRPINRVCQSYKNPKASKILELVNLFDKDFGRDLQQSWETDKELEKFDLDNLVKDRIDIAHRTKPHVDVTAGKLDKYFKAYSGLLDRVYEHFLDR